MKDLNFFSVYSKRRTTFTDTNIKIGVVIGALIILVGGSYLALDTYKAGLEQETAKLQAVLSSDEVVSKLDTVNKLNFNAGLLDQYEGMLTEILQNLKAADYMNSVRLEKINAAMPAGAAMQSIKVDNQTVTFEFNVIDVNMASQLIDALSSLDILQSVIPAGINGSVTNPGVYIVSISAVLKGGA